MWGMVCCEFGVEKERRVRVNVELHFHICKKEKKKKTIVIKIKSLSKIHPNCWNNGGFSYVGEK